MKKVALFVVAALSCTSAMAQMPVPLLDNDAVANPAQWKIAAPIVQAGLECSQQINPDSPALRPLFPSNDTGQWELVPPKGFSVFGLPVQSITIYIDPDGEMGASYTSHIRGRTLAEVTKAAKLNKGKSFPNRKTKMGSLMADQSFGPESVQLTCTIDGTYAAHENEYREP